MTLPKGVDVKVFINDQHVGDGVLKLGGAPKREPSSFSDGRFSIPLTDDGKSFFDELIEGTQVLQRDRSEQLVTFDGVGMRMFWHRLKTMRVVLEDEYQVTLAIISTVPERDGNGITEITFRHAWPLELWNSPDRMQRLHCIRDTVRAWLIHEIDENLFIDGVRVLDPHALRTLTFASDPPSKILKNATGEPT